MPQYVHIDMWPGGIAVVLLRREPVNLMDLTMWQQLMSALDQLEADKVHPALHTPGCSHEGLCRVCCASPGHALRPPSTCTERRHCLQTVRGVVFASGLQREVFTAGNDIRELYAPQTSIARHVHSFFFACAPVGGWSHLHQQLVLLGTTLTSPVTLSLELAYVVCKIRRSREGRRRTTELRGLWFGRYTDFWVTSNVFLARLYRSPLVTVAAIKGACPAGGCCLSLCCDLRVMTEQVRGAKS